MRIELTGTQIPVAVHGSRCRVAAGVALALLLASAGCGIDLNQRFLTFATDADTDICAIDLDGQIRCTDIYARGIWEDAKVAGDGFSAIAGLGSWSYPPSNDVGFAYCAIAGDQTLRCWQQGGSGDSTVLSPPAGRFVRVAGFNGGACGIHDDHTVECWGELSAATEPTGSFDEIAVNQTGACAIDSDSHLTCWGGTVAPTGITLPHGLYGAFTTWCTLDTDGTPTCWDGDTGSTVEFGDGPTEGRFSGVDLCYNSELVPTGGCGLLEDATIQCWGTSAQVYSPPAGRHVELAVLRDLPVTIDTEGRLRTDGQVIGR